MKFGYSMPSSSPLYPEPPYYFEDNQILSVLFTSTAEALRELVPAPLVPNSQNLAYIYISLLNVPLRGKYKEAGIGIPVIFGEQIGNFILYLYLDEAFAIVPGREIWGWPKKDAEISFEEKNGTYQASVSRFATIIIHMSVDNLQPVEPIPEPMTTPNFNLKIIPSVIKGHLPDVAQLTTSIVQSKKRALFRGNAVLEFKSSPDDPLDNLPIQSILGAERSIEDMVMDCGNVLYDYLKENT